MNPQCNHQHSQLDIPHVTQLDSQVRILPSRAVFQLCSIHVPIDCALDDTIIGAYDRAKHDANECPVITPDHIADVGANWNSLMVF